MRKRRNGRDGKELERRGRGVLGCSRRRERSSEETERWKGRMGHGKGARGKKGKRKQA